MRRSISSTTAALEHAKGMLMAFLPGERLLVEADLFDTHLPQPWLPTPAGRSLHRVVEALRLDVDRIVPIDGKPVSWADFLKVVNPEVE